MVSLGTTHRKTPRRLEVAAAAQMHSLIEYAVQAPSVLNSQPWSFKVSANEIAVYADRTRSRPDIDPTQRALVMSCGAAVFYLVVAARHFGLVPRVSLLPDLDQRDLIAYVRVDGMAVPSPETERLFQMIMHRRTQRSPFRPGILHEPTVRNLERAARLEGARLAVVRSPKEQGRIKEVVADARQKRFAVNGSGKLASRPQLRECAAIGILCGTRDAALDHVTGGMALARVLLSAASFGVYASFINDPLDDAESRRELLPYCESPGAPSMPLAVLQLGYGGPDRPSVRRPVHEVTRTAA